MKNRTLLALTAMFFFAAALSGELHLRPIHPDETVEQTLKERFSPESALANLHTIKSYLQSFRDLTAAARTRLSAREWKRIGHTDRETQDLAFFNIPPAVEGALRQQNWLLKKALYQLAAMETRAGKSPPRKLEEARQEMERAEKEFQAFWDSQAIAD
jgi:hypothetical protein